MIDEKPVEIIDLQSANLAQLTKHGVKGNWDLKKNVTGEVLYVLPSKLSDQEAYSFLLFSRKYELEAFNKGIKFQKNKQNQLLTQRIKELEKLAIDLKNHNDYLANALELRTNKEV